MLIAAMVKRQKMFHIPFAVVLLNEPLNRASNRFTILSFGVVHLLRQIVVGRVVVSNSVAGYCCFVPECDWD